MKLALLILLAVSSRAQEFGGHEPVKALAAAPAEDRALILDDMWQRHVLTPDQSTWAPSDALLLTNIRTTEPDALDYLKRKFGGTRPWTAPRRSKGPTARVLTKEGYEKYLGLVTQDAIQFFEAKGAGAKWALKLTDWDGRPLFDGDGRLTADGVRVYTRARLKLEVYWKSPNGETFGTRRPPAR